MKLFSKRENLNREFKEIKEKDNLYGVELDNFRDNDYSYQADEECKRITDALYNLSDYHDSFWISITIKGRELYDDGKVKKFEKIDASDFKATIKDDEDYEVEIALTDKVIEKMTCTCVLKNEDNKLTSGCKHCYALLIQICESQNRKDLINQIQEGIENYKRKFEEAKENLKTVKVYDKGNISELEKDFFKEILQNKILLNEKTPQNKLIEILENTFEAAGELLDEYEAVYKAAKAIEDCENDIEVD